MRPEGRQNIKRLQKQISHFNNLVNEMDEIIEELEAKIQEIDQILKIDKSAEKEHKHRKSVFKQFIKDREVEKSAAEKELKKLHKVLAQETAPMYKMVNSKVEHIASKPGLNRDVKEVVLGVNKILDVVRTESIWKAMSGTMRDLVFRLHGDSLRKRLTNELVDKQLEGIKDAISGTVDEAGWQKIKGDIRSHIWDYNDILALAKKKKWDSAAIKAYITKKVKAKLNADLSADELEKLENVLVSKTLNPNAILQHSQTVRGILQSSELWETISETKPKILDLVVENKDAIETKLKKFLIKKGIIPNDLDLDLSKKKEESDKLKPPAIISAAQLLLENATFIHSMNEMLSGDGKESIMQFIIQSNALQKAGETIGINLSEFQDEVEEIVDLVAALVPQGQKFLPLVELAQMVVNPPDSNIEEHNREIRNRALDFIATSLQDGELTILLQQALQSDSPIMKIADKALRANPKASELLGKAGLSTDAVPQLITLISSIGTNFLGKSEDIAQIIEENKELFMGLISGGELRPEMLTAGAKLVLENQSILDILQGVFLGDSKEAIMGLISNNTKLQELAEQNGIDLRLFQEEISETITSVASLIGQGQKFLPLVELASELSQLPNKSHDEMTYEEIDEEVQNNQRIAEKVLNFVTSSLQDEGLSTWFQGVLHNQSPLIKIANEALRSNPKVLEVLNLVGLSSDEVAPIVNMASTIGYEVLGKSTEIAAVLNKNKDLYQDIISTVITERKYGLSELLQLNAGQIAKITDDIMEITRKVRPKRLIQGQKDNLLSVAKKVIEFQIENNQLIKNTLQRGGFEAVAINNLIQDFLPIALDFSLIAMEDDNLARVHEDIVKKCLIMTSPEIDDKTKVNTLLEVIDTSFELLSQDSVRGVYNEQLVPFLKNHEETIVEAIKFGIQSSPLREKIKIDGKQLVNLASNPKALKQAHDIYKEWKNGAPVLKYMKAAYKVLAGPKELRTVVLSAIYSAITNLVFHEFMLPNFVRRVFAGEEINRTIKEGVENIPDGERKDLQEIFQASVKQKRGILGLITKYSLRNNFCDGLVFEDINFANTDINGFSFRGTTFSTKNNEGISFANSVIKDTNFKGAIFTDDILDLSNTTIDKKSFMSLLPSLDKALKSGVEIKIDGLKLDKLELTIEEKQQINKYRFGRENIEVIEKNTMQSILMENAKKYFKQEGRQLDGEQVDKLKSNLNIVMEVAGEKHLFAKISHRDVLNNFLKKFEKQTHENELLQGAVDKGALEAQVNSSITTARFHKAFRPTGQGIAIAAAPSA